MIVTVFGTGNPTKEGYEEAYHLGRKIGSLRHIVKNGGYGGTMEASAKGCKEVGGETIGVCIKGHKIADRGRPNDYMDRVINMKTLHERVQELLRTDQIVVLPGKLGTLEELFTAWVDTAIKRKGEIYLVGKRNKELIDFLTENDFIRPERLDCIRCFKSVDDVKFQGE